MKTNSEYKNMALQSLEGNWGKAALASLITFIVMGGISFGLGLSFDSTIGEAAPSLISILLLPLSWGLIVYFLRLIRREDIAYSRLFDGFRQYGRILWAELLKSIYILLWTMLLIIPGIIKTYSYAMSEFILHDNPEMNGEQAICESMRMMQGHKMQLFLLDLSLIGWLLLSYLTAGIGFLFLYPYYNSAHAHFYEELKEQQY